ncbi:uncharacterized protein FFB20_01614 [Fusarium fujikuroi]|uniref:Uncharacterized protein n=1 Tax=Fusarium fujikuroi TaxID=5127 RepID=A0A2H3S3L6_FUSFU|nr:uncharacterized protein FFB20_01614 [Fusarium fujikuroi]SCN99508.1 uncharacterized protein FFE2_09380 [Fusarium fujikuroi]SCO05676.1 uncharacterized protein FFM5_08660 [Fusarium fujikuroi]SCO08596.1 uncharacterized protein FFC1_10765 [Fusarium fujikuroi]SCO43961.1 uncharacterized protein FFNC_09545 [Fusarium fujikuroi]
MTALATPADGKKFIPQLNKSWQRGSRDYSGLATGGKFIWIPEVSESLDPPDTGTHNGTASPSRLALTSLHRQS